MKKTTALILCALFLLVCSNAYAQTENNPAHKVGRGITNMASCWLELPKQIYLTSKEYDPLVGLTFGAIKGAAHTVIRASAGVYDTVTFLLPGYDTILVEPEFVFEGW